MKTAQMFLSRDGAMTIEFSSRGMRPGRNKRGGVRQSDIPSCGHCGFIAWSDVSFCRRNLEDGPRTSGSTESINAHLGALDAKESSSPGKHGVSMGQGELRTADFLGMRPRLDAVLMVGRGDAGVDVRTQVLRPEDVLADSIVDVALGVDMRSGAVGACTHKSVCLSMSVASYSLSVSVTLCSLSVSVALCSCCRARVFDLIRV